MKKIILILVIFSSFIILLACGNITTTGIIVTTTSIPTTNNQTTASPTTLAPTTDYTTIVNDEIYLVLLSGVDTVELNGEWLDSGAKIFINEQEFAMSPDGEINTEFLGLQVITYQYTHLSITYEIIRCVIIADQTRPVIELNPGIDTVVVGNAWVDAGVTITDNSEEVIEPVVTGTVDINVPGSYQIIYTAIDSSGNSNQVTRYVTVVE